MQQTAQIAVDGESLPFQLDFDDRTWTAEREFEEAEFPLIAEIAGRRYELYSDGTFGEVET
jgi:hypothetical protein